MVFYYFQDGFTQFGKKFPGQRMLSDLDHCRVVLRSVLILVLVPILALILVLILVSVLINYYCSTQFTCSPCFLLFMVLLHFYSQIFNSSCSYILLCCKLGSNCFESLIREREKFKRKLQKNVRN